MLKSINNLEKSLIFVLFSFFLTSCAFAPSFTPTTMEGAKCKKECAQKQLSCRGSSYTCDQAYARCIEACIDIEKLSK